MKKRYVLIVGILILLVGGYFGVQKFSGNKNTVTIENENFITDSLKEEVKKEKINKEISHENKIDNNNVENFETTNKKYNSIYSQEKNIISFYMKGELKNTFEIEKENPFNVLNRKKINKNSYEILSSDREIFNYYNNDAKELMINSIVSNEDISLDENFLKPYKAISYTGVLKSKDKYGSEGSYDIAYCTYLYILDEKGDVNKRLFFKNKLVSPKILSPNRKYLYGSAKSNLNDSEGGNYTNFVIDVTNKKKILSEVANINNINLKEGGVPFSGSFLENNIFYATAKVGDENGVFVADFDKNLFYFQELKEYDFFNVDYKNNKIKAILKDSKDVEYLNFNKLKNIN